MFISHDDEASKKFCSREIRTITVYNYFSNHAITELKNIGLQRAPVGNLRRGRLEGSRGGGNLNKQPRPLNCGAKVKKNRTHLAPGGDRLGLRPARCRVRALTRTPSRIMNASERHGRTRSLGS
jgi:hypothetical protein